MIPPSSSLIAELKNMSVLCGHGNKFDECFAPHCKEMQKAILSQIDMQKKFPESPSS